MPCASEVAAAAGKLALYNWIFFLVFSLLQPLSLTSTNKFAKTRSQYASCVCVNPCLHCASSNREANIADAISACHLQYVCIFALAHTVIVPHR